MPISYAWFQHIADWDRHWLLKINGWHAPVAGRLMWFASGDTSWLPLYLVMLLLLILKYRSRSWLIILCVAPLIVASDQVASHLIKPLAHRLRQSHEPGLESMLRYLHDYRGGDYGFVSSHTCNVFALATYLTCAIHRVPKWVGALLFLWASFVSYCRIYLGVHYPTGVLVAMLIGITLGWLFAVLYARLALCFFHSKT